MRAIKILLIILCLLVITALCSLSARTAGAQTPTPEPQVYELTLTVKPSTPIYTHPGEVVTFTYRLENTGTEILTGPFGISSSRVPGIECPQMAWGSPINFYLPPGNWITCTGILVVLMREMFQPSIISADYGTNGALRSNSVWTVTENGNPWHGYYLPMVAQWTKGD